MATLRAETAGLVRLAHRDLAAVWRMVDDGAPPETVLRDLLPALIVEYGQAGSALAADWYDTQRDEAGIRGRFDATPIPADDRGAQALIGWALNTATNDASLATLVDGGVQRRVADHVRLTVTNSSVEDPRAEGWIRVGTGSCKSGWCDQFLDGEVRTVAGYDFDAHDGCQCSVDTVWL